VSFAIDGFLQNYGATMIGGLSGHSKTLLLLSITKALLTGKGAQDDPGGEIRFRGNMFEKIIQDAGAEFIEVFDSSVRFRDHPQRIT
jgi:hypothetical protein